MTNKIPLILAIAFSFILATSLITLAILQTNTKLNLPNPDEIKIYKSSLTASTTYKKGNDDYNTFMEIYNNAFEKTYLDQLTSNNIITGEISEDLSKPLFKDADKENGLFVEFVFSTPKKYIIKRNGSSRRVDITKTIFKLSKENASIPTYIYYETKASEEAKNTSSSSSSSNSKKEELEPNYALKTYANTYDLYKHIMTK